MARGRHNKKNRGRGGGGRGRGGRGGGNRTYQDDRQSFDQVIKKNEKFENFYNTLNIVPGGSEREAFWATLRRELPNSFRFTGSKGHALGVRNNLIERFFPLISQIKHEGRPVELPKPIPWYPEGLAYSMTTPRNVVRKYEPFKEFQRFLVSETGVGNISRQEQVSMIPPMFLDVRPEHTVLDLCAAPGSKSAQLIEAVHAGEEERVEKAIRAAKVEEGLNGVDVNGADIQEGGRTTGLLVANDVNYQRAQMLIHQVKRLNSPNLVVTNHDATMFPSIELPSAPAAAGQQRKRKYLKFDRILVDVPCSGDGTCRKNPSIWKDWNPQNGLGLYITQVRILTRALQMLKVGGRVVYSTCSLNPVENEAVVSSAIERCGGVAKVKLLDCSDRLSGLIRNQGLTDWSIMSRTGQIYESFPEAAQYEQDGGKVVPGMFAPDPQENIPLQKCMRVYPHQQDTGGFFIAVLEKLSEIRAKPETESKSAKRDWVFVVSEPEPVVDSAPKTVVGTLLEEIEQPRTLEQNGDDVESAAVIQNAEAPFDVFGAGIKRKASDEDLADGEDAVKKARTGNENGVSGLANGSATANGLSEEVEDALLDAPFEKAIPSELQPPPRKRRRDNEPANEEAFKYLPPTHPELESISAFYELHPSFPRDRFLVRNPAGDPVKGIYYSSQLVKDILITNEGRGMKFVHSGVKMFMKQDSQGQDICRWRIQTEGLPIVEGWVGEKRVVRLTKRTTLRKLLVEMFPKIGARDVPEGEGWKALGEIGEQVLEISMGCCVLRVEASEDEDGFAESLTLPLWRSLHSLNLMLPKEERKAMLLRIFNEDTELINHSDPRKGGGSSEGADRNGETGKGSIPAEEEAKELQRRIEKSIDDSATLPAELTAPMEADGGDEEDGGIELEAIAVEEDAVAKQGRLQTEEMEGVETKETRIAEAMPGREGDGDEVNTTV